MYLQNKFFRFLFGQSGDLTTVPDAAQPSGAVSYDEGFPSKYSLPYSDPARLQVPRDQTNQLYNDFTSALKQYQEYGIPEWISSSDNGGTAKSYSKGVKVLYTADAGATWNIYISLINSNTATPGTDATKWALYNYTTVSPYVTSGGTADAITAIFSPAFTAYTDIIGVYVRASAANTSTTPTINVNGLGAKAIVKGNNQPLVAGDIPGAGYWMLLQYDASLGKMVLLNPYQATIIQATESTAGKAEIATQAETNTGTDDARIVTPLKMVTYLGTLVSTVSAVTYTSTNKYTIAHSLGSTPTDVSVNMRLKAGQTDLSYPAERNVMLSTYIDTYGGFDGVCVSWDDTYVYINVNTDIAIVDNAATPVAGPISTASKWEFVVTAYA